MRIDMAETYRWANRAGKDGNGSTGVGMAKTVSPLPYPIWKSLREESSLEQPMNLLDRKWDAAFAKDDETDFLSEPYYIRPFQKIGRNDPCPCGSGKKYKKCCLGGQPTSGEDSP